MEFDKEALRDKDFVIGCDEVGRGPIAGPVVGCAVGFSSNSLISKLKELNVTDSKKLSTKKRKVILESLGIDVIKLVSNKRYSISYQGEEILFCLIENDHNVIDQINILQASMDAMKRACDKLELTSAKVLVDGNKTFKSKKHLNVESVVKGDSKVLAIGVASIIAKEFRDEKMKLYDIEFPGYNLSRHAGYPTREHKDAVKNLGPSPIHRKTFKGVKEYL